MRKWNFSAGPAAIPEEIISELKDELLEYSQTGASIIETGHRTEVFSEIAYQAKKDLIDILKVPQSHEVLFLHGGATHQFSMIPLNFRNISKKADYVVSGTWSQKAALEGGKLINANIIASSLDNNFSSFPEYKDWNISNDSCYIHYCPNETIQGISLHQIPEISKPLIADMSSIILSEPIDVRKFSMIYASAQKNIGPAGMSVIIIDKDFMNQADKNIPNILRYDEHAKSNSMLNTPPTFSWYVAGKVFKWIKKLGGLEYFKKINNNKSKLLYELIDSSDIYRNNISSNQRSKMNITFEIEDNELSKAFLKESNAEGFLNLGGHASVGGFRASIYNAMPQKGVEELVGFMKNFEITHS